jgi:hypothetical protein
VGGATYVESEALLTTSAELAVAAGAESGWFQNIAIRACE